MRYTIYMHRNKKNNKRYIGITSKIKVEDRWGKNGLGYQGSRFYKAILKYGWDNFEHIILAEGLTGVEARKKEVELIAKYNTFKKGYNSDLGGNLLSEKSKLQAKKTRKEKGYKMSDAEKEYRSELMKTIWLKRKENAYFVSEDVRKKISNSLKNNKKFLEDKKGRRYIKKNNITKFVKEKELKKYLLDGWELGRVFKTRREVL